MKCFTANQRLLIYSDNGSIMAKNLYNNANRLVCDSLDDNYCVNKNGDNVCIMYGEKDGGLFFSEISDYDLKKECILERKSGESKLIPYATLSAGKNLYFIYGLKTEEQEIIAFQKHKDEVNLPETVASGKKLIFDCAVFNDKIGFAFYDENRVIIKIYDCKTEKWEEPKVIEVPFYVMTLKLSYKNGLNCLVFGNTDENLYKLVNYDTNEEKLIFSGNVGTVNSVSVFDNCTYIETEDKYITIDINGNYEVNEYSKIKYKPYTVLCTNLELLVMINNNFKIKGEFERFVRKERAYALVSEKIRTESRNIKRDSKEMDKIIDDVYNMC